MDWSLIKFYPNDFNTDRESEVKWVVENLNGGERLLDVGCLDSKFAELMLPYYNEVWGIDIRTKDDRGKSEHKPYNFVVGSIINYDFGGVLFDDITFISTLEHIGLDYYTNKDIDFGADKKALDSCYNILKPSGRILVTVPYSDSSDGRYIDNILWERNYSDKSLDTLINKALFVVQKNKIVGTNIHFILKK